MPKKAPDYRQERDHMSFLMELKSKFSSPEDIEARFRLHLSSTFAEIEELSPEALDAHLTGILGGRNLVDISRTTYVEI